MKRNRKWSANAAFKALDNEHDRITCEDTVTYLEIEKKHLVKAYLKFGEAVIDWFQTYGTKHAARLAFKFLEAEKLRLGSFLKLSDPDED